MRPEKPQVVCWMQTTSTSSQAPSAESKISQQSWAKGHNKSPVVHLDVIAGIETHEVVLIHADGRMRGLSHDLQKELWYIHLGTEGPTEMTVQTALLQTAQEARQGLLKHREDLLAAVATASEGTGTAILSVVTRARENKFVLHVVAIQPSAVSNVAQVSDRARLLVKWPLPDVDVGKGHKAPFSFGKSSETLYHVCDQTLTSYTFTTLGPRVLEKISLPPRAWPSFIPLPKSLALLATPTECMLMNTHYNSVLATQSLSSDAALQSGKKRKRNDTASSATNDNEPVVLLDYFRTLNIAVAVQHDTLLAIQLRFPTALVGRPKKASRFESRLIESLGRGVSSKSKDVTQAPAAIDAANVDELAHTDPTLAELAKLFTSHHEKNKAPPYVSLEGLVQSLKWVLRSFTTPALEPQPRLPSSTSEEPKLNGTSQSQAPDSMPAPDPIEDALLAEAAKADADLSLAVALITSSTNSLNTIPDTTTNTDTSDTTLNARALTLQTLLTRLGTSQPPTLLAHALRSQLSRHDLFLLIELLRHALEQGGWTTKVLDVYPTDDEPDETGEAGTGGLDSSIAVIGRLLSCAVDALGAGAWLTGGVDVSVDSAYSSSSASASDDDDDDEEDEDMSMLDESNKRPLLPTLRHLTASVLEVTQEAAFFRAFLADFLRYADTLAAAPQGVRNRLLPSLNPNLNHTAGTGSNAVVIAGAVGAVDGAGVGVGESMLPMGVRPARGIEKTRVGAGGEVKARSKRDLADRIQRTRGRYEFERIRI